MTVEWGRVRTDHPLVIEVPMNFFITTITITTTITFTTTIAVATTITFTVTIAVAITVAIALTIALTIVETEDAKIKDR